MEETSKSDEITELKADEQSEKTVQEEEQNQVAQVDEEKSKAEEFKNKFYYLAAEMENLKRRHERENEQLRKYGQEKIINQFLEVVDNFDLTLEALKKDEDAEGEKLKKIIQGIEMIRKQFIDNLAQNGLTPIVSLGESFDPQLHEAILQEEKEGMKSGDIINEFQKGYMLNGRLLRASKVSVAK